MKPREKISKKGAESLTDIELLGLLIGSGSKERDFSRIASDVERSINKTLNDSDTLNLNDIMSIKGVGLSLASRVVAGIELGRRYYDSSYKSAHRLLSTKDARAFFDEIRLKKQEFLMCAFINARFEVLAKEVVAIGTIDRVGISTRDLLGKALKYNAYGLLVAHNHPSGDSKPSQEDILATKRLKEACELMDVKLVDHLILSEGGFSTVPF